MGAFEMWCWRRLLRIPWTARRSIQSILKEISPEYSRKRLMLKLTLQYFGHLMWKLTHWKRPWWWKRLKAEGEGDNRGWDGWMTSPTPQVYLNPCPLSSWCHPTISSSVIPNLAFSLSQHQGLFKWVSSSHLVAKVLEFQLQHQSFQFRTDLL